MSRKVTFTKYQDNRRLWNTTDGSYATIQSVINAVLTGDEVEVLALPGKAARHADMPMEDITHNTLVDALARQEHLHPKLSVDELVALIRGEILRRREG